MDEEIQNINDNVKTELEGIIKIKKVYEIRYNKFNANFNVLINTFDVNLPKIPEVRDNILGLKESIDSQISTLNIYSNKIKSHYENLLEINKYMTNYPKKIINRTFRTYIYKSPFKNKNPNNNQIKNLSSQKKIVNSNIKKLGNNFPNNKNFNKTLINKNVLTQINDIESDINYKIKKRGISPFNKTENLREHYGTEIIELKNEKAKEEELKKIKKDHRELNDQVKKLEEKFGNMPINQNTQNVIISTSDFQSGHSQVINEMNKLKEENEQLKKNNDILMQSNKSLKEENEELKKNNDNLKQANEFFSARLPKEEKKNIELEKKYVDLKKQYDDLKTKYDHLKEEYNL
jgi:hypothetical protein